MSDEPKIGTATIGDIKYRYRSGVNGEHFIDKMVCVWALESVVCRTFSRQEADSVLYALNREAIQRKREDDFLEFITMVAFGGGIDSEAAEALLKKHDLGRITPRT